MNIPYGIYLQFLLKEILIQTPGEPREHHLGEVRQKSSSYTTLQNDRKGRYTLTHFWEKRKKVKNHVTGPEKEPFLVNK